MKKYIYSLVLTVVYSLNVYGSSIESTDVTEGSSNFGSRFNVGVTAFGLYGYAVGGYLEYRHNDIFSIYANSSYNQARISYDAEIETDPKEDILSQELITVGGEMRLFIFLLGYEHVVESVAQIKVKGINPPTSAYTFGIVVPYGKGSFDDIFESPRVEYGIYYKQFNDTVVVKSNEQEKSDSFVGGIFLRLRVF